MSARPAASALLVVTGLLLLTACSATPGSSGPTTSGSGGEDTHQVPIPAGWVDDEVTFPSPTGTVHGSYLHASATTAKQPAALLIAGSGPTDRNGDSAGVAGHLGTLRAIAGMLAGDGVASLRYDKFGTGATGKGSVTDLSTVGLSTFADQAAAGLGFLAARPDADPARLTVIGHSEGSLYAQLLATGTTAGAPPVHAMALLEPLSHRFLDVITAQITRQVQQAESAGQLTKQAGDQLLSALASAVAAVRAGQPVPTLPPQLSSLFQANNLKYAKELDAVDPAQLGAATPAGMPVLVSCSDADIQVLCSDAQSLAGSITGATLLTQHGVSHVLKVDASKTAAHYTDDLPFSPELAQALPAFLAR